MAIESSIPLVDFGQYRNGSNREKKAAAAAIGSAFENIGFVYLTNHGVPPGEVDKCFEWVSLTPSSLFSRFRISHYIEQEILRPSLGDEEPSSTSSRRFPSPGLLWLRRGAGVAACLRYGRSCSRAECSRHEGELRERQCGR